MGTLHQHRPRSMVMEAISKVELEADTATAVALPVGSCRRLALEQELEE